MTSARRPLTAMIVGLGIWFATLSLLYAVQGAGCARGWNHIEVGPVSLLRLTLLALWLVTLAALAHFHARCRRARREADADTSRFLWRASAALTVSAVAATSWIGIAIFVPSVCR